MMTVTRSLLDRELSKLRDDTQRLSSLVIDALDKAMEALAKRNIYLAKEVIANDREINVLRYQIEEDCLRTLATQQPAAGDLRVIVATTHIAGELERIGDHAASIADVVERIADEAPVDSLHKIPKMAKHARLMVQRSIEAFMAQDAELALSIVRREEKIDKHYETLFQETLQQMAREDSIQRATFLLWVGRHLERAGDRATNIAERVVFLTTGDFVEIG